MLRFWHRSDLLRSMFVNGVWIIICPPTLPLKSGSPFPCICSVSRACLHMCMQLFLVWKNCIVWSFSALPFALLIWFLDFSAFEFAGQLILTFSFRVYGLWKFFQNFPVAQPRLNFIQLWRSYVFIRASVATVLNYRNLNKISFSWKGLILW